MAQGGGVGEQIFPSQLLCSGQNVYVNLKKMSITIVSAFEMFASLLLVEIYNTRCLIQLSKCMPAEITFLLNF